MIKKSRDIMAAGKANKDLLTVKKKVKANPASGKRKVPVEHPELQEQVNSIIHEWLTDMWLLTTGEEIDDILTHGYQHNGKALAILCDGQMQLTGSKLVTLEALRVVGIEMS